MQAHENPLQDCPRKSERQHRLGTALEYAAFILGVLAFVLSAMYTRGFLDHFNIDWALAASLVIGIGLVFKRHRNIAAAAAICVSVNVFELSYHLFITPEFGASTRAVIAVSLMQTLSVVLLLFLEARSGDSRQNVRPPSPVSGSGTEQTLQYAVLIFGVLTFAVLVIASSNGEPYVDIVPDWFDGQITAGAAAALGLWRFGFKNYRLIFAFCAGDVLTDLWWLSIWDKTSPEWLIATLFALVQLVAATALLRFQHVPVEQRHKTGPRSTVALQYTALVLAVVGFTGAILMMSPPPGWPSLLNGDTGLIASFAPDTGLIASFAIGLSPAYKQLRTYTPASALAGSALMYNVVFGPHHWLAYLFDIASLALVMVIVSLQVRASRDPFRAEPAS